MLIGYVLLFYPLLFSLLVMNMNYMKTLCNGVKILNCYLSPKLHILEDHVVPFVRKCGVGSGFYGEQSGESIHKKINAMKHNYSNIKNACERLKYVMCNHLAATNPNASSKRVLKKKRNLKRTVKTDN